MWQTPEAKGFQTMEEFIVENRSVRQQSSWGRSLHIVVVVLLIGCGGGSSTSPTSPTAPSAPAARTFALSGQVTDTVTSQGVSGARVSVVDGPSAGTAATTDASGAYAFPSLREGGFTVSATADDYAPASTGVTLTSNQTANLQLRGRYEGSWRAPESTGTISNVGFTVRGKRVVSISFTTIILTQSTLCAGAFSATLNAEITQGRVSTPFSSGGLSSTLEVNFASESTGTGTLGNLLLTRFSCGSVTFSGGTAGGQFSFSRVG